MVMIKHAELVSIGDLEDARLQLEMHFEAAHVDG